MTPASNGKIDPHDGDRPYQYRRHPSSQKTMPVQNGHTDERTSHVAAVDQIPAGVGRESPSHHKGQRPLKCYGVVLMGCALGIGLGQSGHHHRAGSGEEYQTIQVVQLLQYQPAVSGASYSLTGYWMILRGPSQYHPAKYNSIQNKQNYALDVAVRDVRDGRAVVRNYIITKVGQGGRRLLGRPGKVKVGDGTAEYSHEHVAEPPQDEGDGDLEIR